MKAKTIKQTVTFPDARPMEVYNLIMDEKKAQRFLRQKGEDERSDGWKV